MKKLAKEAIKKKLEEDQQSLRYQLRQNIYEMKKLVEKQTIAKRQIAVYQELIRSINT